MKQITNYIIEKSHFLVKQHINNTSQPMSELVDIYKKGGYILYDKIKDWLRSNELWCEDILETIENKLSKEKGFNKSKLTESRSGSQLEDRYGNYYYYRYRYETSDYLRYNFYIDKGYVTLYIDKEFEHLFSDIVKDKQVSREKEHLEMIPDNVYIFKV